MLSLKPRPFVQSSFDVRRRSDSHTCFFLFMLFFFVCLFGDVALSEYYFYFCFRTISAFSLYGEYVVRSFLPDGVFSTL